MDYPGSSERAVRVSSAAALGYRREARATGALIEKLEDGESRVRVASALALGNIGSGEAVQPLVRLIDRDQRLEVRWAVIEALRLLLESSALSPAQARQAGGALIGLLDSAERELRIAAAKALARLDSAASAAALIRALDGEADLAVAAIDVLAELATAEAIEPLARLAREGPTRVRTRAGNPGRSQIRRVSHRAGE